MNAYMMVAIATCTLSLTALGIAVRLGIIHGKNSTKLDYLVEGQARLEHAIGNGAPGVLVRNETFAPMASEVGRIRERIHDHSDRLQDHESRITVAEMEIQRLGG